MYISVIIPIFKGQKYISRIIKMLEGMEGLNKEFTLEVVFINDCPESPISIKKSSIFHIVSSENKENLGIHASRIEGLKLAQGDYIVFLDQDDILKSSFFCNQIRQLKNTDAVVCNGLWRGDKKIFSGSTPISSGYDFEKYLENGYPLVSLGQLLIKRICIPEEWINNSIKYNGWDDHFLWAAMMKKGVSVYYNDKVLYIHEENGENASFNWAQMAKSGENYKRVFLEVYELEGDQKNKFEKLVKRKIDKYLLYAQMEKRMRENSPYKVYSYLQERNIQKIAIYGMGIYGKKLYDLLKCTKIEVMYGIDQYYDEKKEEFPVYSIENKKENVDAIIVTPIADYENIETKLRKYHSCKIFSLLEVLS